MYYVQNGELHVSDSAMLLPYYKKVKSICTDKQLKMLHKYIFFTYTQRGSAAKDNMFRFMPIKERELAVFEELKIFLDDKDKSLLDNEHVKKLIQVYRQTQESDADKEVFRLQNLYRKWSDKQDGCDVPDEMADIIKTLTSLKLQLEEAQKTANLDDGLLIETDSCPKFLFEMPESLKPAHLKISLYNESI
jgi:hypothetical protein